MPTDTRPQVTHSGRGGAGNIRPSSHSRTREDIKQEAEEEALQEQLIADARGRQAEQAFSTGRGGVGNISRSRSRSKARTSRGESSTRREGSALGLGRRTTREGFGNISEEKEKNSIELEKASLVSSLAAFANLPSHLITTGDCPKSIRSQRPRQIHHQRSRPPSRVRYRQRRRRQRRDPCSSLCRA